MIKDNLKLKDTFLVTVEILSTNAIIVSANINNVVYRGALLECSQSTLCNFKSQDETKNKYPKRINVRDVKRNLRLKSFKSDYNLRRTNHKIIQAKQIVCKSELKEIADYPFEKNTLSIVLKKHNGGYRNVLNLVNENDEYKTSNKESDIQNSQSEQKRNVIKIKKIKVNCNQYQYSISTEDSNKDDNVTPSLSPNYDFSLPQLYEAPVLHSLGSNTVKSFSPPSLTPWNACTFLPTSFETNEIKSLIPVPLTTQLTTIKHTVTVTAVSSSITQSTSDPPSQSFPLDSNITKMKIVKKPHHDSFSIKSTLKNDQMFLNHISMRYNCKHFRKDDIIWAKLAGYSIWPAKVLDIDDDDHVIVLWLGNNQRTSRLHKRKLWDFGAHFHEKFNKKGKGHYLDAVQQAQVYYRKLDFSDISYWQRFDISSESSTLESVNIDDSSYEYDRFSSHDLRTNVYLPVPEEEFELSKPSQNTHSSQPFFFEPPDELPRLGILDINI